MQNFSQIVRLVFEIAFIWSFRLMFKILRIRIGQGPYPALKAWGRKDSRPPSGQVCALWRYLAYVVEGHASACPRTVGVSESVWRWRYRCYVELVVRKVVSTENFEVKEKETSLNFGGLAQKPRKRRIKIKVGHCACHLAGTSSSPPQGGRWNVLNCFLFIWIITPNIWRPTFYLKESKYTKSTTKLR